jgi:hypothetical protein
MYKLYFICDESGSKGFADNQEKFAGEYGVFAGYFLTDKNYNTLKNKFKTIYEKYVTAGQKLHITDLTPENQENLRKDVFECLKTENISCVYEAISVKGYHREFENSAKLEKEQNEKIKNTFSFSKNQEKGRLHSELFQAVFGKAIAYYNDTIGDDIEIQIITDNIDNKLKKEFEEKAKELINPLDKAIEFKAFDKEKKQPVTKTMTFASEQLKNDNISKTKFNIISEVNELTLIADILANTVSYYLKKAVEQNPNIILNSKDAIQDHPLLILFYGLSTDTFSNIVSDKIYGRMEEE